jgi:hypothetical protein
MTQQMPSRPPSAPLTGYRITDQVPGTEIDPTGRPARGVRIHFLVGETTPGSVFVAENRYTPANVQAEVAAKAATIAAVAKLQG